MRVQLLLLLLITSLLALSKRPEAEEEDSLFLEELNQCAISIRYPSWFAYPKEVGVVAFSNAQKSYIMDAYDRVCAYKEMRVKGIRYAYSYGEQFHEKDSMDFFYLPSKTIDTTMLSLYDEIKLTKGSSYFISYTPPKSLDTNLIYLCDIVPWDSSRGNPNRYYAIGVQSFSRYSHGASWVTAEDNAVKRLVKKIGFSFAAQSKLDSREEDMTEVIRYEFDILVKNLRVERRWFDEDSFNCYVLVSCSKSDIALWNDSLPRASEYNSAIYGVDTVSDLEEFFSESGKSDSLKAVDSVRSLFNRRIEKRLQEVGEE